MCDVQLCGHDVMSESQLVGCAHTKISLLKGDNGDIKDGLSQIHRSTRNTYSKRPTKKV